MEIKEYCRNIDKEFKSAMMEELKVPVTIFEHIKGNELPEKWRKRIKATPDQVFRITIEVEGERDQKEQARYEFFEFVDDIRKRTEHIPPEEMEEIIQEAVEATKKEELRKMKAKT